MLSNIATEKKNNFVPVNPLVIPDVLDKAPTSWIRLTNAKDKMSILFFIIQDIGTLLNASLSFFQDGGHKLSGLLVSILRVCRHIANSIGGTQILEPRHEKTGFCICENKDADQLRGNREADQRLCFRYIDGTIPLLPKLLAVLCGCTALFVWDLVGNPEDRFSHNEAH